MKRRATDWETDEETRWRESGEEERGGERKGMRKSEGPQRAVPVEKSCNVGGLSWENMHGL